MPALSSPTGLTITNPLLLYRALIATQRLKPDPTQHRLAIHLQKLYHRLKDYQPATDFSHRLNQINALVERDSTSLVVEDDGSEGERKSGNNLLSGWRRKHNDVQTTAITRRLTDHQSAIQLQSPQGLLLYGEVGTGKSLLVDLLADCLPNQKKRRWHFNTFMLETFAKLESFRRDSLRVPLAALSQPPEEHSILRLARDMISRSPILFLDEFQLPDRAASKILSNLLTSFFHLGGVLIATSNRMPEELANASGVEYALPPAARLGLLGRRWGLPGKGAEQGKSENMFAGRGDFADFLEVLRARCEVWDMEGSKDWRREEAEESQTNQEAPLRNLDADFEGFEPALPGNIGLGYEQSRHTTSSQYPDVSPNSRPSSGAKPKHYFVTLLANPQLSQVAEREAEWRRREVGAVNNDSSPSVVPEYTPISWTTTTLRVYGRNLLVPRQLNGVTKWKFEELCVSNLGPADYITLASTFHTFILTGVPVLTLLHKNEARRLITLLDALYEARCKLLISAEAGPDDIFFPETQQRPFHSQERDSSFASSQTVDDEVYPETLSEIYQDQTSPFRPNISSYTATASAPSYASSSQPSSVRSILADEDSDFGPLQGLSSQRYGRGDGAPGAGNEIGRQSGPDFSRTGAYTGEDEKFAYKRARSRLWEMCGARWWTREGDWWRPLSREIRHWEGSSDAAAPADPPMSTADAPQARDEALFRHGASPFRTSQDPPPKFSWTHAWGMMEWGKKAGAWGKGPAGLAARKFVKPKNEKEDER